MSASAIAREAIAAIDLESRVRESLRDVAWEGPGAPRKAVVLALGKAAPAMARGALSLAPASARAVVVTADGTDTLGLETDPRVRVMLASHPIPDERSRAAAEALLEAAQGAAVVVALISGGASALACSPVPGLSFAQKQQLMAELLDAGAPIADVNVVRRHLSRLKGGGLARTGARVFTRIVSDVLVTGTAGVTEGAAHDIGSGPASFDPTSRADALAALTRWAPQWLPRVGHLLVEGHRPVNVVDQRIVAAPSDLVAAARDAARARGLTVEIAQPSLDSVDALADEYVVRAQSLARSTVLLRVAEPSVVLPKVRGRGGRAGRLALSVWARGLPSGVELSCIASDGVDGSSGAAGAVVTGALAGDDLALAHEALDRFDDASFLSRAGRSIPASPTGNNLLDLHVLLRPR